MAACIDAYRVPHAAKASDTNVAGCTPTAEQLAAGQDFAAQVASGRLVASSTGSHRGNAHTEEATTATAEQGLVPKRSHVKSHHFYGKNRKLLIDQRVAHLRANVQQRLRSSTIAPFERFSLQRHAFAWAAQHELAADLR